MFRVGAVVVKRKELFGHVHVGHAIGEQKVVQLALPLICQQRVRTHDMAEDRVGIRLLGHIRMPVFRNLMVALLDRLLVGARVHAEHGVCAAANGRPARG